MVLGMRVADLGDEGSDFVEERDPFLFRFGSESVGAGNSEPPKAEALRRARYWVLLPFGTYLIAIPGLGPGAYFVPVVVYLAPLGVISYFDDVSLDFERSGHQTALLGIHAVFWFFFVLGLIKRERFSVRVLTTIWVGLVVLLFMSVTGCTMKFGEGLRSPGNWH